MPGEVHGAVIDLVWPDGNDDGELYVRGHVPDEQARQIILAQCDELEGLALATIDDEGEASSDAIEVVCRRLVTGARVEHGYARWSREAQCNDEGLDGVLRYYSEPGPGGRFPVTRLTLFPRPRCHLSFHPWLGVSTCTKCGRRFRPENTERSSRAPADCMYLLGDEVGPFTKVAKELEPEAYFF